MTHAEDVRVVVLHELSGRLRPQSQALDGEVGVALVDADLPGGAVDLADLQLVLVRTANI